MEPSLNLHTIGSHEALNVGRTSLRQTQFAPCLLQLSTDMEFFDMLMRDEHEGAVQDIFAVAEVERLCSSES